MTMRRAARAVALALVAVALLSAAPAAAVTVEELALNPENCAFIRLNVALFGYVPCPCRANTGNVLAFQCHPNCCPKTDKFEGDRCHSENRLLWTPYEQSVCVPRPPSEYTDDTPNCFDKGNNPIVKSVVAGGGTTFIGFELSITPKHQCDDLFVATCDVGHTRPGMFGFRLNTTDVPPRHCWIPCEPSPIMPCTQSSCVYNRGYTAAVVRDWTLATQLVPGTYALVCRTIMTYVLDTNTLYQYAYASTFFRV
jgi:hypothetical protein